ncbi:MAG: hypothetical protein H6741_23330 [Alphaproteobacteria bacterium]|nr:hypothetical protein [Alphaproteobacteria bacterium]
MATFTVDADRHVHELHRELRAGTWTPGGVLSPRLDGRFSAQSFACIAGRGLELKHPEAEPRHSSKAQRYLGYRINRRGLVPGPRMRDRLHGNLRRAAEAPETLRACVAATRSAWMFPRVEAAIPGLSTPGDKMVVLRGLTANPKKVK